MTGLLTEKQTLWDYLVQTDKPIFLYGMGDGALKIMDALRRYRIPLAGIYASDEYVRGHSFEGYPVKRYSEVCAENPDFISLLAFASQDAYWLDRIDRMAAEHELYAPDVPVVKTEEDSLFTLLYLRTHEEKLDFIYRNLADELSQKVFLDVLNFKISGKVSYLKDCASPIEEVYRNLLRPNGQEVYADLGAYNGDTVLEYLTYARSAARILVMEPDRKNYQKLVKNLEKRGIPADCYPFGAWDKEDTLYFQGGRGGRNSRLDGKGAVTVEVDSLDRILNGARADIIKYDVEGAEQRAVAGSAKTIAKHKPKLMVSAYHKNEDLFALPLQILEIRSDYRIFLRHHPYIPAWETNFYFI